MTTVNGRDLSLTLRRAAVRATLAPSIHNTQPWRLVLRPNSLEIHADWDRRLRVVDPRGRQLLISCGCAIFNARVAVAASGYEPEVTVAPDPSQPDLLARITPTPTVEASSRELVPLDSVVELRHTNRWPFSDDPMPASVLRALTTATEQEGCVLLPLATAAQFETVTLLSAQAAAAEAADPQRLVELQAWTTGNSGSSHRSALQTSSSTESAGMDAAALGISTGWTPAPAGRQNPECLLLLGTLDDSPAAWLRAGQATERVLLEITRRGFVAHPTSQIVEVADVNAQLCLDLSLIMHPHMLIRVGRAAPALASRRRRLVEMLTSQA